MALLLSFLHRAHAGGLRYVLVITGKGSSFGSEGVLQASRAGMAGDAAVPRRWCASHDSAARQHGGAGAHLCAGCGGTARRPP